MGRPECAERRGRGTGDAGGGAFCVLWFISDHTLFGLPVNFKWTAIWSCTSPLLGCAILRKGHRFFLKDTAGQELFIKKKSNQNVCPIFGLSTEEAFYQIWKCSN